mmetsp:Transcript_96896/g.207880  ORF Transcript_96896/g.207880 Transcript_96896/m.207880 type:complete len:218 (-) Transcript_96896:447-1100(-)
MSCRQVCNRDRPHHSERLHRLPLRALLSPWEPRPRALSCGHIYAEPAHAGGGQLLALPERCSLYGGNLRALHLRELSSREVREHHRPLRFRYRRQRFELLQPPGRRLLRLPSELLLPPWSRGAHLVPARDYRPGEHWLRSRLRGLPSGLPLPVASEPFYPPIFGNPGGQWRTDGRLCGARVVLQRLDDHSLLLPRACGLCGEVSVLALAPELLPRSR